MTNRVFIRDLTDAVMRIANYPRWVRPAVAAYLWTAHVLVNLLYGYPRAVRRSFVRGYERGRSANRQLQQLAVRN